MNHTACPVPASAAIPPPSSSPLPPSTQLFPLCSKVVIMIRNIYAGMRRSAHVVQTHGRRQFVAASAAQKTTKPAHEELSYTERQKKTGRPLSPHVSVYVKAGTFPTIAISSILNRATGVSLSLGLAGCGALAVVGVDVPTMMYNLGHGDLAPVFKFWRGVPACVPLRCWD